MIYSAFVVCNANASHLIIIAVAGSFSARIFETEKTFCISFGWHYFLIHRRSPGGGVFWPNQNTPISRELGLTTFEGHLQRERASEQNLAPAASPMRNHLRHLNKHFLSRKKPKGNTLLLTI
jgi:hypothetical protein